ncbi:potassium transporter TrkH [Maritimibacter sp. 55A14]|uniref:TrkH family potassium uptake protein n=1 Tax=Maritimibacter sp. 55A14 TaxID=2174844 RepID=UPI000D618F9E|nr:potassium transporter TrkG [Maritimibacter sp. 55A14]PWE33153.1 potassium transporter TrkH [Maritimibacter sp. 55A14]
MDRILQLPLFLILALVGVLAMYIPAAHGFVRGDYDTARVFFYFATLLLFLCLIVGLASANYDPRVSAGSHLLALLGGLVVLPVFLALPMSELVRDTHFLNLYFEMVSSLTTTGASVFDAPERLNPSLHLWKGLVAWLGGFLFWLSAIAIMEPLNLGGFEVFASMKTGKAAQGMARIRVADASERLVRYARELFPVYLTLTLLLWIGLLILGEGSLMALIHAMSTISTSGISPAGGPSGGSAGLGGEFLIFFFLFFAVSRATFSNRLGPRTLTRLRDDREFQLALICLGVLPLALVLRHWLGALEVEEQESLGAVAHALWGGLFTVMSFMTTTGFASADWAAARDWSGLQTPGLILMGLALMGGGVATTAGGIKLLRVHALYKHGLREMEKLVYSSSVGGAGIHARRIRREGAHIAWIFFMLFMMSVALVMIALSLTGVSFEESLTFSIAALSTTGPLASVAAETPLSYGDLNAAGKLVMCAAMILGRMETLAIIALLNPDFWR